MFAKCEMSEGFPGIEKKAICLKYFLADVYFCLTRRGNAMEIHVASYNRLAKLRLRDASHAIIHYIRRVYDWCEMIIATVKKESVYNLCLKVGFKKICLIDGIQIMTIDLR